MCLRGKFIPQRHGEHREKQIESSYGIKIYNPSFIAFCDFLRKTQSRGTKAKPQRLLGNKNRENAQWRKENI